MFAVFAVLAAFAAVGLLGACFPAPLPMTSVTNAEVRGPARCLVVLLPGILDDADDFREEGMLKTLKDAPISADVVAANATFGYYRRGLMPDRLFEDVIEPARARRDYEHTWLIGISMGGLGALLSAQKHAEEIDGVILLAPYMGNDDTIASIKRAGDLASWTPPPPKPDPSDDFDVRLWAWLKEVQAGKAFAPDIAMGAGKDDRFRDAHALLAKGLAPGHVFWTSGGHDWGPWNRVLAQLLRESEIASKCGYR